MISRMCAAGFVVVFSAGLMLAPNETFGRPGGFGARSFPFVSGFPPLPFQPTVHAARRIEPAFLHRRRFGSGFPLYWLGGWFPIGSDYIPSDFGESYYRPDEPNIITGAVPVRGTPYVAYRQGCRTQTVTVPAEAGGETSINIVRC